ncbi:MAG: mechanosensitive ion channel [Acidocella sp.]|nr:mechanosensitive ion channel [Acidocella sp.]
MRSIILRFGFLALITVAAPGLAAAQSATPASSQPAANQPPAPAPAATAPAATPLTTPAKGLAGAIIPGSPLAALTGAATPVDPDDTSAAPFGTNALGLSVIGHIADDATSSIAAFASAVRQSTRLTPITDWLKTFTTIPSRAAHARAALVGLLETIVPAIILELLMRAVLRRPRAAIIRHALARRLLDLPHQTDSEGLADAEAGETEKPPQRWLSLRGWITRFGLALGYILLALLPIAGFAVTSGLLIGAGLITIQAARLIAVGTANAYLFCRLSNEALLFIMAPHATDLRLIQTTDERARWLVRALMVIIITIALGYVAITSSEILGLSHDGAQVMGRLFALAGHIELAILVWQSRTIVARWIRGNPDSAANYFGLRPRLAGIWHIVALFYILALWIAYAGGVQNAFVVLLRVVGVFLGTLVAARLLWLGTIYGLDLLLNKPDTNTSRLPVLRARAKSYSPLLKLLVRLGIAVLVVVFMLEGWGVNVLPWLLANPLSVALISAAIAIIITIAVALLLWELANAYLSARIERLSAEGRIRQASRLHTLLPMLKATIGVTIGLVAGLICLSKIGVNAAPLLAGAGVLGIAIGFGSQKLVQDIITGLFLLLEDAMQVGDTIALAGMTGTVERLSIRTIRLRGGDGSLNIIPFSAVTTVTNMTRDFGYAQISIQVAYNEDLPRVYAVMTDIAKTMRAEPRFGAMMRDDLQIFGLDAFGASALVITGQIRTGPGQHWAVRREYYARLKQRFADEHIEMPYYTTIRSDAVNSLTPHKIGAEPLNDPAP